MENKTKNFVMTTDFETAQKLRSSGLQEIENQNGRYVFINSGKLNFADEKKIVFTNKLCV